MAEDHDCVRTARGGPARPSMYVWLVVDMRDRVSKTSTTMGYAREENRDRSGKGGDSGCIYGLLVNWLVRYVAGRGV